MNAYIYRKNIPNSTELEYLWKSGAGLDAIAIPTPTDITIFDMISPANFTLKEKIFWLNQQDKDIYEKYHKGFMCYKYTKCAELRTIIGEWNKNRTNKIKGVSKMRLNELISVAEKGKYQ